MFWRSLGTFFLLFFFFISYGTDIIYFKNCIGQGGCGLVSVGVEYIGSVFHGVERTTRRSTIRVSPRGFGSTGDWEGFYAAPILVATRTRTFYST